MDKILGITLLGIAGYLILKGQKDPKEIEPEPITMDFLRRWGMPKMTGTQPDIFNITIESPSLDGGIIDTVKSRQVSNYAPTKTMLPALIPTTGMTRETLGTAFDISMVEQAGGQISIDPKTGVGTLIKVPYKPITITQKLPPTTTVGAFTV